MDIDAPDGIAKANRLIHTHHRKIHMENHPQEKQSFECRCNHIQSYIKSKFFKPVNIANKSYAGW